MRKLWFRISIKSLCDTVISVCNFVNGKRLSLSLFTYVYEIDQDHVQVTYTYAFLHFYHIYKTVVNALFLTIFSPLGSC